MKRTEKENR